jgi:hypothetical protein
MNRLDGKGHEILLNALASKAGHILAGGQRRLWKSNSYNGTTTGIADDVSFSSLPIHERQYSS